MPDPQEPKSERVSFAVSPTELKALEFIRQIHGDRYEGTSSVLRDYSISDALAAYERAHAVVAESAA